MARSIKKGPFVDAHLLKKVVEYQRLKSKKVLKTWSRRSTIIPDMLGVGVPVLDREQNVVAALSVAAIRSRLSGARLHDVVAALQRAAAELSADLLPRP